jgi:hypothetical protein
MIKKILTVFILTATASCTQQKIIPEKTLVEIVYRMQLADAMLLTRDSHLSRKDSMRIYEPMIEKFGYTLDDLHRTLLKHTAEDGKLQSILNRVVERINAEQNNHREDARIEKLSENMNLGSDSSVIVSKTINKHNIEVSLSEQGVYDVSASYFFYKDDSTRNPKMAVWLESKMYRDSIVDKQEVNLVKDTVFVDYSIRVRFNNPEFNVLKVYWIDFEQKDDLSKSKPATSLSTKPAIRSSVPTKKTNLKLKRESIIGQHLIISRKSVRYNFEESDTTRIKETDEFIGPLLPDSLVRTKISDSVAKVLDTLNRIEAIKRKDSTVDEK